MRTLFARAAMLAGVALSAPLTGCFFSTNSDGTVVAPARTGAVTLRWSIDGSFDPAACDAFAAANARIDVYDVNGTVVMTKFVDCRAFASRVDLYPGDYTARVQMVDVNSQPRSTSLPVHGFTIIEDTNLTIDVDFPRDSFY